MKAVSKNGALSQYGWGHAAMAWSLVDGPELSVKLEKMPAGEEEVLHRHQRARQFFFVLKGWALLEVEGSRHELKTEEGLEVGPGQCHRIMNHGDSDLEFLLCSQPAVGDDRINE